MTQIKFYSVNHVLRKAVMSIILLTCSNLLYANVNDKNERVNHAVRVLKGLDMDNSKDWAISALLDAATVDTIPYAMNCLGLANLSGNGVEKDTIAGINWLEKAGQKGYALAYHNLGMLYKDGKYGVKQNFFKAYEAFCEGAKTSSLICKYEYGFMLYKGLGCQQNYEKAALMFEEGANKNYSPSLYMLGLCYRNGYGVEQDTVRANILLKHSASLGYTPAMDELRRPNPENYLHEELYEKGTIDNIPTNMPIIEPELNDISLVNGSYRGFLVMYDWSGKFILGEKPVEMDFIPKADGNLNGLMVLANDTISFEATLGENGKMKFSSGSLQLNERYSKGGKMKYRMDEAMFDIWKNKICGSLRLYSLNLKEPERPMYIELSPSEAKRTNEQYNNHIAIAPNPFSYDFTATFELNNESDVNIRIFDQFGALVYKDCLGILANGKHHIKVCPHLNNGLYVLNIKAGQQVFRTIIVKKGGAQ